MKNFNPKKLLFLLLLLVSSKGMFAQAPLVWGVSPFQDSLWSMDTTTWSVANRVGPTLAGFTITGMNGLAWDPIEHETYIIMKVSGVTGRVLGRIDLATGVVTQVGNLGGNGANYSSIAFRKDGQLFGVIGDGGSPSETMFTIDKTTATTTMAVTLGNGADGEVVCYNYDDDMFYHWSGNGTLFMEKFPAQAPYTPVTNIAFTGSPGGETFGALYLGNSKFLMSNINSNLLYTNVSGVYGNSVSNNPDDLRGLVMPPNYQLLSDTVCVGDVVTWNMVGMAQDTAVYDWGDGTSTSVFPAGPATHIYTSGGNYTSYAILKNNSVGLDSMTSAPIVVRALPSVALAPGADTTMCFADSLTLNGTFGGASQWYMDGAPITGANTNNLTVTANGVYNMIKTNMNGCSDSASVGISVKFGDQPAAWSGADSTICNGDSVCFTSNNPLNVTYLWSTGNTINSECFSVAGTYSLTATDPAGCAQSDTATIAVILAPNPTIAVNSSGCPVVLFSTTDPNGTSYDWTFGDTGTGPGASVSHTYTANGTYTVNLTETNSCFTATATSTVVINCITGMENSLGNAIQIAPNPSQGRFVLSAALPAAASLSYQITDLNSRTLVTKNLNDVRSNWSETIDFHAASGMYFISVTAGEDRAVYRLVIE